MSLMEKYFTTKEVAEKCRVTYLTVYYWIKTGVLTAYKLGREYKISEKDLNKFIKGRMLKVGR